ncbi:MAG: hypothetical protein AAF718_10715 [Pseudomonadota bacterium]
MASGPERRRLFLERESYQRRRWADAARLLPLVGFVLLLLPVLLKTTNDALVYIFSVWALLIIAIGIVSRRLSQASPEQREEATPNDSSDPM